VFRLEEAMGVPFGTWNEAVLRVFEAVLRVFGEKG